MPRARIPRRFQKLATAIIVMERPVYWEGQCNGGSKVQHKSAWHTVHIQDGLVLFGVSQLDVQVHDDFFKGDIRRRIPGFCEQFPAEWDRRISEEDRSRAWPKVVLDDGGWFAWLRDQDQPSHKSDAEAVKAGGQFTSRNIERNRQLFLSLNRKED